MVEKTLAKVIRVALWWSNRKMDDTIWRELSVGELDVEIEIDLESIQEFPSLRIGLRGIPSITPDLKKMTSNLKSIYIHDTHTKILAFLLVILSNVCKLEKYTN